MDLIEAPCSAGAARPVAVFSPHILMPARDRALVYDTFLPRETLAQYFERTGLAPLMRRRAVRVTIDGHQVPPGMWAHCRPRPGTLINIAAIAQDGGGGGGGKNPLATIVQLAIFVFNPGAALAGPGFLGLSGVLGKVAGMAINFGLGLVANALFPPPRPQIAEAQGQVFRGSESPTYSLSGGSNRARPFEPLPMIAGTHKIFADLGATAYTEFEGDDQILFQVFEFGYNTVALSDYRIGQTPLTDYDDYTLEESGTDGALDLFPGNVDAIAGGSLTYAASWVTRTSSLSATALVVEVTGDIYAIRNGAISDHFVDIEIEYRAVGAGSWSPFLDAGAAVHITNASRRPVRLTYRREVTSGQYEVRVRRTSADETFDVYVSSITWSALRTYQPDTADYTGRKRVALKIKATGQLNGQVGQFSAIARASCEAWTGAAWVETQTDNPAWWFRAIALGRFVTLDGVSRRVWGAGLASARVDHEGIKAWGAWCATKDLSFNAVFDRAMSAEEMLAAAATCGRASLTWANGKLGVVYDQAAQPVTAVFGMSNIVAGSFSVQYQTEQLADEVVVSFINPALDWQRDTVRCVVPGTTSPTRTRSIELFGCTDLDMAGRAGNLYVAQNLYRSRHYTWRTDFDGMAVSRGDVVQLAHDLTSYDYSGRLIEGSTASVLVLERAVPLDPAGTYITLVEPDGTFATHAVASGSGDSASLTLVTPLSFNPGADPDHPPYDYRWLYGATATPGQLVKIDAIKPVSEHVVEISAIDEVAAFYAAEDGDYTYTVPRANFGGATIANLQVVEEGIRAANGYLVRLVVLWDAQNDYAGADVFTAINDGPETAHGFRLGRSAEITVNDGDVVAVRVVATGSMGSLGQTTTLTLTHTTAFASALPPSDISSFTIDGDVLTWGTVGDVDVVGYRIKFAYGRSTDWGAAALLHQGLLTDTPWRMPVPPAGDVTFMIVAVDAAGSESLVPAAIYVDLGAAATGKVLETIDLDALGYPGTVSGGSVSGGDVLADSSTLFWNSNEEAAFWGDDTATYWPAASYAAMTYTATVTPTRAGGGSAGMTIDASITGNPYTIEYRRQGPGAFWASADAATFWGADAATFWPDPPEFSTWPGRVVVANEPYDLRIVTGAGATQGAIATLTVSIDVPYLTERFNDVVIASGGTRLAVTGSYTGIDNVQVTVQADGNGAIAARIVDKDVAGPLLQCFDASGAAVAGLIDAVIQAYQG